MFWRQGLTELLQILLNHIKFLKQTRVRSPPNQEKIVSCHTCHPKGGQNIEKILKVKQFSKMLQYSFFCAVSLYEHIIFRNTPDLATFTSVWSLQTSNPAPMFIPNDISKNELQQSLLKLECCLHYFGPENDQRQWIFSIFPLQSPWRAVLFLKCCRGDYLNQSYDTGKAWKSGKTSMSGKELGHRKKLRSPGLNPGVFIFQQWWTNHLCASMPSWALGLQLCAAMSSWFVLIRGHLHEGCAQGTGPFGPSASIREN